MDTTPNVPGRKRKTMQGSSLESPIGRINPMRRSSIGLVTSTPVVFQVRFNTYGSKRLTIRCLLIFLLDKRR